MSWEHTIFINHNGIICHISKVDQPHKIWYHIWIDIARYGEDYIRGKLGVTDDKIQRKLQDEFCRAAESYKKQKAKLLEGHNLRLDKTDCPYYLHNKTKDSVTVFIEKGLFTLYPSHPSGMKHPPLGYSWSIINKTDTPEIIQAKLYDHRKRFGPAMRKKLWKVCGW